MMDYVIISADLYLHLAVVVAAVASLVRTIRGKNQIFWPWEKGFWVEGWVSVRVGLLWPWLIYRRVRGVR